MLPAGRGRGCCGEKKREREGEREWLSLCVWELGIFFGGAAQLQCRTQQQQQQQQQQLLLEASLLLLCYAMLCYAMLCFALACVLLERVSWDAM
ncbi:hypothetical protein BDD12DRAFT_834571 [Trichophaea hybrida]|nr:hypothetical protein BDD12DRAFT_834571 [Trichophaea hybrida]